MRQTSNLIKLINIIPIRYFLDMKFSTLHYTFVSIQIIVVRATSNL